MSMTETQTRSSGALAPILFTATIFLSASLLFFVQPLFAKIVLPVIGGAPSVWTTAMLFFQTVLIGGYLYAHLVTRYLPAKAQLGLHLALWAAALVFLPLGLPESWSFDPEGAMAWQTLGLFALGVGVPFAVLSANAPLIQSWYAGSGGPSADDPYFLYGASNLGSLIALLGFPLLAEPLFGASQIGIGWMWGFWALGGFLLASGLMTRGTPRQADNRPAGRIAMKEIGYWLFLAFLPSSLMLAVTTKIATDIGSVPLVWVVPLSLYLLTFVLTFTHRQLIPGRWLRLLALPALAWAAAVFLGLTGSHQSWSGVIGLVAAFFVIALLAHQRLYDARPDRAHLTLFYVVMSVGGALGGLFNSIIAPTFFDGLYEGGATVILALGLVLSGRVKTEPRKIALGLAVGVLAALPMVALVQFWDAENRNALALLLVLGMALSVLVMRRNLPAAALAAGIVAGFGAWLVPDGTMLRDRSFFGTHKVHVAEGMVVYANGTTVHGAERLSDRGKRPEPLFYYHPNGAMAQILAADVGIQARDVGVVGLGVGSLACYVRPGQTWQFYEIDPVVDRIARNPNLFGFMHHCAGDAPTHLGDARTVLAGQDVEYDLLFIDAYSSDAVPVHLTTLEAMKLYLDRLKPGGVLVYHISNRYYAIERPLARSAEVLGLEARIQNYRGNVEADRGDTASRVVMLARNAADFGTLTDDPRWAVLESDGGPVWTDDHANLLGILE